MMKRSYRTGFKLAMMPMALALAYGPAFGEDAALEEVVVTA